MARVISRDAKMIHSKVYDSNLASIGGPSAGTIAPNILSFHPDLPKHSPP